MTNTADTSTARRVAVTEVTPESITLDANHPLAGVKLIFDIKRVE